MATAGVNTTGTRTERVSANTAKFFLVNEPEEHFAYFGHVFLLVLETSGKTQAVHLYLC